jgi:catechol 2,3-dioxygenase-like lactoylglutathione lyase family enzyme
MRADEPSNEDRPYESPAKQASSTEKHPANEPLSLTHLDELYLPMSQADPPLERPQLYALEVRTNQWAELVRWYRNVLGLRVLVRVVDDAFALLEAGGVRLELTAKDPPGPSSERYRLAFEVGDLDAAAARLDAAKWKFERREQHPEGFSELVTLDPDGNRIRLFQWPLPPQAWPLST